MWQSVSVCRATSCWRTDHTHRGETGGTAALLQQLVAALLVEPAALRAAVAAQAVGQQLRKAGPLVLRRWSRCRSSSTAQAATMPIMECTTGVEAFHQFRVTG